MNIIPMNTVNSSQIASVGFDPASGTLAVEFKSGSIYHYSGVNQQTFKDMMAADSIGSFFHQTIRSNPDQFPHKKVSGK